MRHDPQAEGQGTPSEEAGAAAQGAFGMIWAMILATAFVGWVWRCFVGAQQLQERNDEQ